MPSLLSEGGSPVRALAEALACIAASDPIVKAWAYVDEEGAADAARMAEQERAAGRDRGPLHGVPVGVKDIIDVAGLPTRFGSAYFAGNRAAAPSRDAGSVAALRAAGAVVLGKTHTHEFAFGGTTPPTRNPHDLDRIPGGSSGGSAAAVAAGHVRLTLGTDTGGSVRIPSAYCGTVGVVPSPGLLSGTGSMPLAWSLDRIGLITSTVADMVAAMSALGLGRPPTDMSFEGVRIGVLRGMYEGPVDEDVVTSVAGALALAEGAGAKLVDIDVPHQWAAIAAGLTIILAEGAEEQRARRLDGEERFGADVRGMLAMADQLTAATYVRAQRLRTTLREELLAALAQVDVLATPTMPNVAPRADEIDDGQLTAGGRRIGIADSHLRYNIGANLAALPCATQPLPRPAGALPVGLQWTAAPGRDDRLLATMTAMEALWQTPPRP